GDLNAPVATPISAISDSIPQPAKVVDVSGNPCSLTDTGYVLCWGHDSMGGCGQPQFMSNIGDNEHPSSFPPLQFTDDEQVVQIDGAVNFTCAVLTSGRINCWGSDDSGALGHPGVTDATETPASYGVVDVGGPVASITTGHFHACALLTDNTVRCWGLNDFGQLGLGHTDEIGDNEDPADAPTVQIF
ncbi:MAG TPA: hypothetical protein VK034_30265, partial [Enhygromyxa sp.]|nr:hypothetical protein [Enhygromyxa sp.]